MTIHVLSLNGRDRACLMEKCEGAFLNGECYAFALALHEGTGWPLLGLMQGDEIAHAGVRAANGCFFDARGPIRGPEFGAPFGVSRPYRIRKVSVEELRRAAEPLLVRESNVRLARSFAETLWPELPWKQSRVSQALAFLEELESLCDKHGVRVTGLSPGSPPTVFFDGPAEHGYELERTLDTFSFMFRPAYPSLEN